jgi:uncharacterized surface protein with fasciclin (FAS1) repeats
MKKFIVIAVLTISMLVLAACGATNNVVENNQPEVANQPANEVMEEPMEEEAMPSIAEIAVADGRFTTLVAALDAAGLVETLSGEGAFTVFAPTDDAFAALPEGTVEALLADIPALTDILLYHVVDGVVPAEAALTLDGQMVETLSGEKFSVSLMDGDLYINDAKVIITDIEASNGIIHVVDAVILPPAEEAMEMKKTIAEIAVEDGRFTTLVAALDAAGLVETFAGEGAFTVFAPTDDAFAALPEGTVEALLADIPALTEVLTYHVLDGVVPSETALTLDANMVETLSGKDFYVSVVDGNLYINGAMVIIADIEASNGVIHVIDAVLLPPAEDKLSIAEIAVADGRFNTLVAALDAAGLVETFAGEGSFTVFAPTDDAFAALPEGTVEGLLADIPALTNILTYHVLGSEVPAEVALTLDGQTAETLSGASFSLSIRDGSLFIDEAQVIITDIMASNGIIHVIDAVLIPAN